MKCKKTKNVIFRDIFGSIRQYRNEVLLNEKTHCKVTTHWYLRPHERHRACIPSGRESERARRAQPGSDSRTTSHHRGPDYTGPSLAGPPPFLAICCLPCVRTARCPVASLLPVFSDADPSPLWPFPGPPWHSMLIR